MESISENINRADASYTFRLVIESLNRRGGQVRTAKILQEYQGEYFLHYKNYCCLLESKTVKSLLNLLANIDVSIPPLPGGGFDGIDYKLTIGGHVNSLVFSWWTDQINENWQPLIELREAVYNLCRKNFQLAADEI
ncbi:MAG: hypothetical protein ACRYFX_01555 [Janthinobacterium lividum]